MAQAEVSDKDVSLVETSWSTVKNSGATFDAVGMNIFVNLYKNYPYVRNGFQFMIGVGDSEDEYRSCVKLQNHARGVVEHVDKAVQLLSSGQVETLVDILKDLGQLHRDYGVGPDYFNEVGESILLTLQQALGDAFTSDVKQAWANIYGVIARTMAVGMAT